MIKKINLLVALGAVILLSGCSATTGSSDTTSAATGAVADLGRCLTEKGATFYGTERCPHCKDQKAKFGDALSTVNYVDCDAQKDKCATAGVDTYPTWIFADGSKLIGAQELPALAAKVGCTYTP